MAYKVVDYKKEARGRVTSQFEDKEVFNRYLDLLLSGSMELQAVLKALMEDRWIDTARGEMLDVVGRIVGQSRLISDVGLEEFFTFLGIPLGGGFSSVDERTSGGRYIDRRESGEGEEISLSDTEYRTLILAKIFKNNTNCTPNEFIDFFSVVLGAAEVRVEEVGSAHVNVEVVGSFTDFQESLLYYYKQNLGYGTYLYPKPVGVSINVEVLNYRLTEEETIGETNLMFIDSHILRDVDDSLGFYVAAKGDTNYWYGCTLSFSRDSGNTFFKSVDIDEQAVMGTITEDVEAHPHWYRDENSTINLKLFGVSGENILSNTHEQVLNRNGMILVGDEIMNYESAEDLGGGEWRLTKLLRGRKNGNSRKHLVGERVVFLDYGVVPFIKDVPLDAGETYTIRVRSKKTVSQVYEDTITYKALSQTETSPAKLRVVRDGDDMRISWLGVGKKGSAARSGAGTYFDGYRVKVGSRVYDTEDQNIMIPYEAGLVQVFQMNKLTGEGIPTEVMV